MRTGDSVAVNGCCLTVASLARFGTSRILRFDLLRETWDRTNLRDVRKGSLVNLERSIPANGRLGGHYVTGHIDCVGKVVGWKQSGHDRLLEVIAPREVLRYVVFKGSIAVDGISLTVSKVGRKSFQVWIIPHTMAVTALKSRSVGDAVNLEADILAKYVERLLESAPHRR
jgi:riboflavin synthase